MLIPFLARTFTSWLHLLTMQPCSHAAQHSGAEGVSLAGEQTVHLPEFVAPPHVAALLAPACNACCPCWSAQAMCFGSHHWSQAVSSCLSLVPSGLCGGALFKKQKNNSTKFGHLKGLITCANHGSGSYQHGFSSLYMCVPDWR